MADKAEIDKAIGAHGMWKSRLRQAVDTGKFDTPVETVRADDQCAFGKWLYGPTLTNTDKASPLYKTVHELHAEFHKMAARVAEHALAGNKGAAESLLSSSGEYALISAKLTQAMVNWKNKLG